jgi:hypothetical protein
MSDTDRIAGIVNEWFQTLPTPTEQQRDRSSLIAELVNMYTQARNDWYASNRRIAYLEGEIGQLRAKVAEEIAEAIEAKTAPIAISDVAVVDVAERTQLAYRIAARIARDHGKD